MTGSMVKVNGSVVVPLGSSVNGIVANAVPSGKVKGRARMTLHFTELVLPNGRSYKISASSVSRRAGANKNTDPTTIAGGAGIGSVQGEIAQGGYTRGTETGFPAGSALKVKLLRPLEVI